MRVKRSPYLSEEVSKQYPIEKFKGLIINVIDIVENFIIELGDENKYNSSSTARYEECVGSHQFSTTSKIESMLIKMYDQEPKKRQFIDKYFKALESLDKTERRVIIYTFINCISYEEMCEKLELSTQTVNKIKKSAIVRFALKLGLDKFV